MTQLSLCITVKAFGNAEIYYLEPYRFKGVEINSNYKEESYVYTNNENEENLYKVEPFLPSEEESKRLAILNLVIKNTNASCTEVSMHLAEFSFFFLFGFIYPNTTSSVLKTISEMEPYTNARLNIDGVLRFVLKRIRKNYLTQGIKFKGLTFEIDSKSIGDLGVITTGISTGLINAPITYFNNLGQSIVFKTKEEFQNFFKYVLNYVQSIYNTEKKVLEDIKAMNNEQRDSLNILKGIKEDLSLNADKTVDLFPGVSNYFAKTFETIVKGQ